MRIFECRVRRLRLAATLTALGAVAGCLSSTESPRSDPPVLRLVNASPESFVTVHLDSLTEPLTTLSSNTAAPGCFLVLPEEHVVSFILNGETLDEFVTTLRRDSEYVVVLTKIADTFHAFAVPNDQNVPPGTIGLTLINATATPGDVYVTGASEEPTAATRVGTDLAPAVSTAVPPYVTMTSSKLRVRLFDVGTTTNPRADISLDPLLDGRSLAIVFTQGAFPASGAIPIQPCD